MFNFLVQGLRLLQDVALVAVAATVGWVWGGIDFLFFQRTDGGIDGSAVPWFRQPAVVAAIVAGTFVVLQRGWEYWRADRKEQDAQDVTLAGLTQAGWQAYLTEVKNLHEREIRFKNAELVTKDSEVLRDRFIKHECFNEIGKLQGFARMLQHHISLLEKELIKCGCATPQEVPEYAFKYQDDITRAAEERLEQYKRTVQAQLSGAPDITEG